MSDTVFSLINEAFLLGAQIDLADSGKEAFAQFLARFSELRNSAPSDSVLGAARRLGVLNMQPLFYKATGSDVVALAQECDFADDPDEDLMLALFAYLGESVLNLTEELLPTDLKLAADEFRDASAERQQAILQTIHERLLPQLDRRAEKDLERLRELMLQQLGDQPLCRILPAEYIGALTDKSLPERLGPNCFGKGQILAAFARRAGARYFGATPIVTGNDFFESLMADFLTVFESAIRRAEVPVPSQFSAASKRLSERHKMSREIPSYFHMGIVIQLRDERWQLVDPNFMAFDVLGPNFRMTTATKVLEDFRTIHPGLVLLGSDFDGVEKIWEGCVRAADESFIFAKDLHRKIKKDPMFALRWLAEPGRMESILKSTPLSEKSRSELTAVVEGTAFLPQFLGFRFRDDKGKLFDQKILGRMHVALALLEMFTGESLTAIATQEGLPGFQKFLESHLPKFVELSLRQSFNAVTGGINEAIRSSGATHPMIEFYDAAFRTGVELIAHMNAVGPQSEEWVEILAHVCGGESILLAAATAPLRVGASQMSSISEHACQVLREMPARSRTVEAGLAALEAAGFVEESQRKGGEESDATGSKWNDQLVASEISGDGA